MKVYKIVDKESGLFSNGGTTPRWTKTGKTWSQIGHLKSHLRQHVSLWGIKFYKNARVLEIEVVETVENGGDVSQLLIPMIDDEIREAQRFNRNNDKYYEDRILRMNGLKSILLGENVL